jgi:rRNA pseudouridine-1189 N-methylase Emg1 (Nep1/Mra1 family)
MCRPCRSSHAPTERTRESARRRANLNPSRAHWAFVSVFQSPLYKNLQVYATTLSPMLFAVDAMLRLSDSIGTFSWCSSVCLILAIS